MGVSRARSSNMRGHVRWCAPTSPSRDISCGIPSAGSGPATFAVPRCSVPETADATSEASQIPKVSLRSRAHFGVPSFTDFIFVNELLASNGGECGHKGRGDAGAPKRTKTYSGCLILERLLSNILNYKQLN